jgi:uncharacterized protein YfiM (DUF2279 family)
MLEANGVLLEIVALTDGRFGVRKIGGAALDDLAGEFDTRAEAESWILQRSMTDDEAGYRTGLIKPGDGEGVG